MAARFYLVAPPRIAPDTFARDLAELGEAADIACLLVSLESRDLDLWRKSLAAAQSRGVAVLIDGPPDLALAAGADGVHVRTGLVDLKAALERLKPDFIVGAGGLATRHDAMVAGESGVDYVAFGEPHATLDARARDQLLERVGWWAELFEIPCVAFADGPDMVRPLAEAGADFIAVSPQTLRRVDSRSLIREVRS